MKIILFIIAILGSTVCFGQKENKQIAAGNLAYQKGDFKTAAQNYEQALKINPKNQTAKYNLANSLEKQKNVVEASKLYEDLAENGRKSIQSDAYYNNGVSQVHNKDLKGAISSFENSLRRNPNDQMARENLQKAINDLKQQQQNNKQNNKQDNKQKQPQQPKDSPKDQQNKKDMDNLLKQLSEQEKDLQKKLQQQQQQQTKQPEKDW